MVARLRAWLDGVALRALVSLGHLPSGLDLRAQCVRARASVSLSVDACLPACPAAFRLLGPFLLLVIRSTSFRFVVAATKPAEP